jgi:hypothetical protein
MFVSNVAFLILFYLVIFLALGVVFAIGMTMGYKFRDRELRSFFERKKKQSAGKKDAAT